MATIPKTGIVNGQPANASQVTNIIDALDGTTNNEINILGTLSLPDIADVSASIASAATPAGSNQQIQFNNGGAFGGSSKLTFNASNDVLTVGTASLTEISLPSAFIIKDDSGIITFNQGQEDVITELYGFGGSTSLTLGEDTATLSSQTLTLGNVNSTAATLYGTNITLGNSTTASNRLFGQMVLIGATAYTTNIILLGNAIQIGNGSNASVDLAGTTVNVGSTSTLTQLGAANQRIKLGTSGTTTGVITEGNTYVIKSGANAFNIGTSTSSTLNANNRINFEANSNTTVMTMRGLNGSTQNTLKLNNFGTNSTLASDVGNTFSILNNFSATSDLAFGSSTTQTFKMILYVASNSDNSRPGASGGSRGGLLIQHTLELGGTSAWKTSGTTWSTTSDSRLKENITTASLDICYDTIKTLPLKRFNYVDKYSENPIGDRTQLGWIAQDVSSALPKAVVSSSFTTWVDYSGETITGSNNTLITSGSRVQDVLAGSEVIDDILTLDSDQIIKMMYGAIQKLQAKVETLENQ